MNPRLACGLTRDGFYQQINQKQEGREGKRTANREREATAAAAVKAAAANGAGDPGAAVLPAPLLLQHDVVPQDRGKGFCLFSQSPEHCVMNYSFLKWTPSAHQALFSVLGRRMDAVRVERRA